jgi:hypothetical protein
MERAKKPFRKPVLRRLPKAELHTLISCMEKEDKKKFEDALRVFEATERSER